MNRRAQEHRPSAEPAESCQESNLCSPDCAAPRPFVDDAITRRWKEAAADLSTAQLVERTTATAQMVYRYRRGQLPKLTFLVEFATAFGFSLDWLLSGRGPRRLTESTRWALETAGPRDLCEVLGALAERGDRQALGALAGLLAPEPTTPTVVVRRAAMHSAEPPPGASPARRP